MKPVTDITPTDIRAFLIHQREDGHNEGGIHKFYQTTKVFLRWYEDELEPENWKNPIRKVKAPRQVQELVDPVDEQTVKRILATFNDTDIIGARNKAMILMLYDTGVRAVELLTIQIENIDIVAGSVKVMGKGRKARTVWMGKKCRKAVRNYIRFRGDKPGPLFLNRYTERSGGMEYSALRSMMRRACDFAGIKDVPQLHSFRRAFALNMLRNGADVYSLKELMGHADLQVLQRYLKQTNEDLEYVHRKASPLDNSDL